MLIGKPKPEGVDRADADDRHDEPDHGDPGERDAEVYDDVDEDRDDVVESPRRLGAARRRLAQKRWLVPIAAVLVVALVAGAFFIGRSSSPGHTAARPTAPPGFATFQSRTEGFSISYPRQWQVVPNSGGALRLSMGANVVLSLRTLALQDPAVNTNDQASIKAFTDALLSSPSAHLQVLSSRPINIAGIGGYYYIYTFPTGSSANDLGVHAHYFLFQGRKLIDLVFQAIPVTDFQTLAPVFDQVSASLHSDPAVLPPPPAPGTTAPGTTAPGTTAPGTTAPGTTAPGTTAPATTTAPGSPPGT
ncbi:MAG: hypothetical protein M3063_08700 [Actinomycetota bacterium]|nr:hypothetical protein [Actinomycetota bacterium]